MIKEDWSDIAWMAVVLSNTKLNQTLVIRANTIYKLQFDNYDDQQYAIRRWKGKYQNFLWYINRNRNKIIYRITKNENEKENNS